MDSAATKIWRPGRPGCCNANTLCHMRPCAKYLVIYPPECMLSVSLHFNTYSHLVCVLIHTTSARVWYSTALPHLLLFIIFFISHVYYICYFLLSMYGYQGNAGTLLHVIFY